MCDEIKVTAGFCYRPSTDVITGLCCEHVGDANLLFTSAEAFDDLLAKTVDGTMHLAVEASVFAVAGLGREDYAAQPIMGLGTCKRGGKEAAKDALVKFLNAWRVGGEEQHGAIWAFGTDGDTSRRPACNDILRAKEAPDAWGDLLRPLKGLDTLCSDTGIVLAPDYKHLLKRWRSWLIHPKCERKVGDFVLTAAFLKQWLTARNVQHIKNLMAPADKMNVSAAQALISAVADADPEGPIVATRPNSFAPYLLILNQICRCILAPLSTSTSLQEQLQQLSTLGHLIGFLFSLHGKYFIPTPLYHDTQSYIKAAYVLTARGKVLDDPFELFLSQVGDDQLEELFGVVRTTDHNSGVTTNQLETKLTISAQVNSILSRHPQWRPADRRRGASVGDIIRPRHCTATVTCGDVDVASAWRTGRLTAHDLLVKNVSAAPLVEQYWGKVTGSGSSLLCPSGRIVGVSWRRKPRGDDASVTDDEEEGDSGDDITGGDHPAADLSDGGASESSGKEGIYAHMTHDST
eukprot:GHVU01100791.1.p1 GENE.GHVU01100791.1~~GHVU01100791.1.p1  ORF type:complete len:519 (-),score=65.79 GHVU01100791.1:902-2458(-)